MCYYIYENKILADEVIMAIKKVIRIGNSIGCIFGKEAEILSGIKLGDKIEISADKETIIIKKVKE